MQKRLYRSQANRMLAGVCGGLGDYFGLDPTLVRVGFVALLFFDGIGLIAYLVLAVVVPSESMRGGRIEQSLEENVNELAQAAEKLGERVEQALASRPTESKSRPTKQSHPPRGILGGVLVTLGIVLLLRNLNIWWMIPHVWLWPAAFIFVGLVIIALGMRRSHD